MMAMEAVIVVVISVRERWMREVVREFVKFVT